MMGLTVLVSASMCLVEACGNEYGQYMQLAAHSEAAPGADENAKATGSVVMRKKTAMAIGIDL
jgi:hypothetical protein